MQLHDLMPTAVIPPKPAFDIPLFIAHADKLALLPQFLSAIAYDEADDRRTDRKGNPKIVLRLQTKPQAIVVCPNPTLVEDVRKVVAANLRAP